MSTCPGTRIKELRTISGMSQEELGRRVGVQRAAINKYEKGTVNNIPLPTIEKIANVFNVSPTYIVYWDELKIEELSMESKVIKGIEYLYGKNVVELLESYVELSDIGKNKVQDYVLDMWKMYHR